MPGPLRATGDPDALYNAGAAILVPDTLQERNRLSDELVELAQRLDDQRLSFWAAQRQGDVVTDAGDRSQTEPTLAAIRTLTASVPEPTFAWMRARRRMPLTLRYDYYRGCGGRAIISNERRPRWRGRGDGLGRMPGFVSGGQRDTPAALRRGIGNLCARSNSYRSVVSCSAPFCEGHRRQPSEARRAKHTLPRVRLPAAPGGCCGLDDSLCAGPAGDRMAERNLIRHRQRVISVRVPS
jgi:hypothetical protein